jgi:hypothetical protein
MPLTRRPAVIFGFVTVAITAVAAFYGADRESLAETHLLLLALLPTVSLRLMGYSWWATASATLGAAVFIGGGMVYARWLGPLAAAANVLAALALAWVSIPAVLIAETVGRRRRQYAAFWGLASAVLLALAAEPVFAALTGDVTLARSAAQMLYGGAAIAGFGSVAIAAASRARSVRAVFVAVAVILAAVGTAVAWYAAQKFGMVGWWAGFGLATILLCPALLFLSRDTVRNDEAHAHSAG